MELFTIEATPIPPLEQARRELDTLEAEYSDARQNGPHNEYNLDCLGAKIHAVRARVRALEGEAMRRAAQ